VWAFPAKVAVYEDTLVACFRENPEPYFVNLICRGAQPEIHIADKKFAFDRVLLNK